uniref:Protein CWC15 homolog (inferred by orthology to a C. elegans protein) n=1 Tax=Strongyloides venezuelensis TaxID=75913 RepID=A0A0K0EW21_STRVS
MTTAHRPTFDPARGGTGRGETDYGKLSQQFSSKDMPSHTVLKYRHDQQKPSDKLTKKDLLKDLEEREVSAKKGTKRIEGVPDISSTGIETTSKRSKFDSDDEEDKNEESTKSKFDKTNDSDDEGGSSESSEDDSDNSDSEDDDEALLAELARIKKERAEQKAKEEAEKAAEEEKIRSENLLKGNPLLNMDPSSKKTSFKVQRRWDDDVVFKNCAKGQDDKNKRENTFINDTIRSAFHRKFMDRYIK